MTAAGTSFAIGDIVTRHPGERAVVTYVSPTHDYAELRYLGGSANDNEPGFAFRTSKSDWTKEEAR